MSPHGKQLRAPRLTAIANAGFAAGFQGHGWEGGLVGDLAQGLQPLLQDSAGAASPEGPP